jgi:hypothetical protein
MFHVTIELTSKVELFGWLTLSTYAPFARPALCERTLPTMTTGLGRVRQPRRSPARLARAVRGPCRQERDQRSWLRRGRTRRLCCVGGSGRCANRPRDPGPLSLSIPLFLVTAPIKKTPSARSRICARINRWYWQHEDTRDSVVAVDADERSHERAGERILGGIRWPTSVGGHRHVAVFRGCRRAIGRSTGRARSCWGSSRPPAPVFWRARGRPGWRGWPRRFHSRSGPVVAALALTASFCRASTVRWGVEAR